MAECVGTSSSAPSSILGDVFDIAFKANRRNYRLMQRHLGEPRRHTWKDWVFLAALACALAIIFAAPIAVAVWAAPLDQSSRGPLIPLGFGANPVPRYNQINVGA